MLLLQAKTHCLNFTARLVEATPIEAACNDAFGFAIIQKFEVLHTTYPKYKKKFVLIIQPCPEEGGKRYFVANKVYKMLVATTQPPVCLLCRTCTAVSICQNFGRGRLKGWRIDSNIPFPDYLGNCTTNMLMQTGQKTIYFKLSKFEIKLNSQ
jgi:hypothetical protein